MIHPSRHEKYLESPDAQAAAAQNATQADLFASVTVMKTLRVVPLI